MFLSVFDLFRIGIGPSSSHTVGPMRAAQAYAQELRPMLQETGQSINVWLYGSLGATGRGHATDRAIILGLAGFEPATVPAHIVTELEHQVAADGYLCLDGAIHIDQPCIPSCPRITFNREKDIVFEPRTVLDRHPNAVRFQTDVLDRTYFSVGGGFVVTQDDPAADATLEQELSAASTSVPYPFSSGDELLARCAEAELSIAQLMRANELVNTSSAGLTAGLAQIWEAMDSCINAGLHAQGVLPGGLRIPRRAPAIYQQLRTETGQTDPLRAMDWINLYALAVNEENAAGHRVVTAPTNGAAGIIPSVIKYFLEFVSDGNQQQDDITTFLLTAAAVGSLIKRNASIAGAEVGCQGEVGSACAMAAAGLAQVLGGTPAQVENAAEIAMEHNLGLTCDPIGGLVQVPCIERNAIGAVKAINAARMALRGDGVHTVSLDVVIETMRQTGLDMHSKYKETSTGGLAVNIVEC